MSSKYSGSVLAFIGDAYISLYIRDHLVKLGFSKAKDLQEKSITYVSAKGQAEFMEYLLKAELLNEKEMDIYKRGRNANVGAVAKNVSIVIYRMASGFEALIGWLYYEDINRANTLLKSMVDYYA